MQRVEDPEIKELATRESDFTLRVGRDIEKRSVRQNPALREFKLSVHRDSSELRLEGRWDILAIAAIAPAGVWVISDPEIESSRGCSRNEVVKHMIIAKNPG
jgi:hypothetical protein